MTEMKPLEFIKNHTWYEFENKERVYIMGNRIEILNPTITPKEIGFFAPIIPRDEIILYPFVGLHESGEVMFFNKLGQSKKEYMDSKGNIKTGVVFIRRELTKLVLTEVYNADSLDGVEIKK